MGVVAACHDMFQHGNVNKPARLGCIIQRSRAHREYHRLGVHAYDYGDRPWWVLPRLRCAGAAERALAA